MSSVIAWPSRAGGIGGGVIAWPRARGGDTTPPAVPNAPGVGYTVNQRAQYTFRDGKTGYTFADTKTQSAVPNAPGVGYTVNQRAQYTFRDGKTGYTFADTKTQFSFDDEEMQ